MYIKKGCILKNRNIIDKLINEVGRSKFKI